MNIKNMMFIDLCMSLKLSTDKEKKINYVILIFPKRLSQSSKFTGQCNYELPNTTLQKFIGTTSRES